MKCVWCDKEEPELYVQCSGIHISMHCGSCGTQAEYWDWARINQELKKLRAENKMLREKINGSYSI
jgi:hypothetical protein